MNDDFTQEHLQAVAHLAHTSLAVLRRMAHAAQSTDYVPPTSEEAAAWGRLLAENLPSLPRGTRLWLFETPAMEEVWEWRWQGLSTADKDGTRQAWKRQLDAFRSDHPALGAFALALHKSRPAKPAPRSSSADSIAGAIGTLNQHDREHIVNAEAVDPRAALKMRQATDAQNARWVADMARIMHETQMSIIRNITW